MHEAKDLAVMAPRSPREELAGFVIAARTTDKCRASLNNTLGEYDFNCPLDKTLFGFVGIGGEEFKEFVSSGATDDEIGKWLTEKSGKSAEEVAVWSKATTETYTFKNPAGRDWFVSVCAPLGLDPEATTLFDYLDADDKMSFGKGA